MGAVEPEADLADVQGVQRPGGIGCDQGVPNGGLDRVDLRIVDRGGTRHGRSHENESRHASGVGQGEVERDLSPTGVADQGHPVQSQGIEDGHQIGQLVVRLGPIGGGTEATPVVRHPVDVRGEEGQHILPAALIRDTSVQEHHVRRPAGARPQDG